MYVYLIYLAPFLFKVLPSNLCVNLIKKITTKKIVDSVQRYTVIVLYVLLSLFAIALWAQGMKK